MSYWTIVGSLFLVVALRGVIAAVDTRIVNGTTTNANHPYMASLRTFENVHFCGGTIIDKYWVLTSARCLYGAPNFTIVVGTNSLLSGGVTYQVTLFILHPSYNNNSQVHDAGLVKTATHIKYSNIVKAIHLAKDDADDGTVGIILGWGYTSYPDGSLSNELQSLQTEVINHDECSDILANFGYIILSSQFCTFKEQTGGCLTDEGGPFVENNVQYGIISLPTCATGLPDIYTSVSGIRDWINDII